MSLNKDNSIKFVQISTEQYVDGDVTDIQIIALTDDGSLWFLDSVDGATPGTWQKLPLPV